MRVENVLTQLNDGCNDVFMKITGAKIRLITDNIIYFDEIGMGIAYVVDDVIRDLKRHYGINQRRIICRDLWGHYDELVIKNGAFYCFNSLEDDDSIISEINEYMEAFR